MIVVWCGVFFGALYRVASLCRRVGGATLTQLNVLCCVYLSPNGQVTVALRFVKNLYFNWKVRFIQVTRTVEHFMQISFISVSCRCFNFIIVCDNHPQTSHNSTGSFPTPFLKQSLPTYLYKQTQTGLRITYKCTNPIEQAGQSLDWYRR